MILMRRRYLAALLAAAAVAGALLWDSRTVTTNPPAASPTSTESRGVLVISPTDEVPNDLSGVRYLLLVAAKAPQVASLKQRYPGLKVLAYKDLSFFVDYSRNDLGNAAVPWVLAWWSITYYNAWFMVVCDDPLIWFYYNWGFSCLPTLVLLWFANTYYVRFVGFILVNRLWCNVE